MIQPQNKCYNSDCDRFDYHLHTGCSADGSGTVKDYCREAVRKGFIEICITNHQEWISAANGYYDYAMRNTNWHKLLRDIEAARQDFPELSVKLGCEIGYYPQYATEIIQFTKELPFDYVISSVHALENKTLSDVKISGSKDKNVQIKWIRRYYSSILEMVQHDYFDCVGHFDVAKRHIPFQALEACQDLINDIAKSMIKYDIGFELNTSHWFLANQECYPGLEILQVFKDVGIKKVTIGSDAHSPENLGQGILKGLEILKKAGFASLCTFSKRIPTYHTLTP
ncbi:MAG: histidinol-phosphatase HisJ family protein [Deltaproteobacteria bacterium]|jgi:histidinol-phosphatase (PHP family)|nr:histidinol-phosphatase HisJ family protein [Deltaproteobacteria bacterium]